MGGNGLKATNYWQSSSLIKKMCFYYLLEIWNSQANYGLESFNFKAFSPDYSFHGYMSQQILIHENPE